MASLIVFNLKDDSIEDELKNEMSSFGLLHALKIVPNTKQNDGTFVAQILFKSIEKEQELIAFISKKGWKFFSHDIKKRASEKKTKKPVKKSDIENPSFHFYKSEAYGKNLENFTLLDPVASYFSIEGSQSFALTTSYPGLLVGSGYAHPKLKSNNDDFQLGFFFDHTSGLPLISGSSIKGLIRSVFPSEERDQNGKRKERYYAEKIIYLKEVYDIEYTEKLVEILFESRHAVFYDAYISKTENDGRIFGSDFITTHFSDETEGIFKEPNPIKFLKILPEVTFVFQFNVEEKYVQFFKDVLLDFGIGAKTNVGYGKFVA